MSLSVRDVILDADLFRAAYPNWPHAEPEERTLPPQVTSGVAGGLRPSRCVNRPGDGPGSTAGHPAVAVVVGSGLVSRREPRRPGTAPRPGGRTTDDGAGDRPEADGPSSGRHNSRSQP